MKLMYGYILISVLGAGALGYLAGASAQHHPDMVHSQSCEHESHGSIMDDHKHHEWHDHDPSLLEESPTEVADVASEPEVESIATPVEARSLKEYAIAQEESLPAITSVLLTASSEDWLALWEDYQAELNQGDHDYQHEQLISDYFAQQALNPLRSLQCQTRYCFVEFSLDDADAFNTAYQELTSQLWWRSVGYVMPNKSSGSLSILLLNTEDEYQYNTQIEAPVDGESMDGVGEQS
ncbi:hypothetical protein [Pleionea sp. CnH1-48]|uniref:hypothetical protein n=1 Tax=Pleionea sp. CnH1-48 TaxID=2954494 RepID=UPI0020979210|nr:hypothetical protein [Pleionea sp. CnH1-48]MCO7224084.1 hypothetical protein [Pleionea sp. CnH1-48]